MIKDIPTDNQIEKLIPKIGLDKINIKKSITSPGANPKINIIGIDNFSINPPILQTNCRFVINIER